MPLRVHILSPATNCAGATKCAVTGFLLLRMCQANVSLYASPFLRLDLNSQIVERRCEPFRIFVPDDRELEMLTPLPIFVSNSDTVFSCYKALSHPFTLNPRISDNVVISSESIKLA